MLDEYTRAPTLFNVLNHAHTHQLNSFYSCTHTRKHKVPHTYTNTVCFICSLCDPGPDAGSEEEGEGERERGREREGERKMEAEKRRKEEMGRAHD